MAPNLNSSSSVWWIRLPSIQSLYVSWVATMAYMV